MDGDEDCYPQGIFGVRPWLSFRPEQEALLPQVLYQCLPVLQFRQVDFSYQQHPIAKFELTAFQTDSTKAAWYLLSASGGRLVASASTADQDLTPLLYGLWLRSISIFGNSSSEDLDSVPVDAETPSANSEPEPDNQEEPIQITTPSGSQLSFAQSSGLLAVTIGPKTPQGINLPGLLLDSWLRSWIPRAIPLAWIFKRGSSKTRSGAVAHWFPTWKNYAWTAGSRALRRLQDSQGISECLSKHQVFQWGVVAAPSIGSEMSRDVNWSRPQDLPALKAALAPPQAPTAIPPLNSSSEGWMSKRKARRKSWNEMKSHEHVTDQAAESIAVNGFMSYGPTSSSRTGRDGSMQGHQGSLPGGAEYDNDNLMQGPGLSEDSGGIMEEFPPSLLRLVLAAARPLTSVYPLKDSLQWAVVGGVLIVRGGSSMLLVYHPVRSVKQAKELLPIARGMAEPWWDLVRSVSSITP